MNRWWFVIGLLLMGGCGFPRWTHTSAVMIGNPKAQVLGTLTHTLGAPIRQVSAPNGEVDAEGFEFPFAEDRHLLVWFRRDAVVQLRFQPADKSLANALRSDYDTAPITPDDLSGYLIANDGRTVSITPLEKSSWWR